MKKIVFIFSVLCFLAFTSVNAQTDRPPQKVPDRSKVNTKPAIGKNATKLDVATKRDAAKAATRDPDIISRKKGGETIYFRRTVDKKTGKSVLTRVEYSKKSGEFEVPHTVDQSSGNDNVEKIRAPKSGRSRRGLFR